MLAAGCDAGIRYDERLEGDMIAVPIGPRVQHYAAAVSPAYLRRHGRPDHPRDLLSHACLRGRFRSQTMITWEFEREGEVVRIDPAGPLLVSVGSATDFAVEAAVAGTHIITLFEDWLQPHLTAVLWNRFLSPGGQSSPGRSSTIPAGTSYRRRSGRSSSYQGCS